MTRSRDTADQINRINSSAANATAITVDSSENVSLTGALDVTGTVTADGLTSTTSSSMTQLTVNGTGAVESGVNFANGGTTYGQIYFNNASPYDMSMMQQYSTGSLIFGTNDTERMRLDASGNVLVGKTSVNSNTVGVEAKSDGTLTATVAADTVSILNRKTSDGEILRLQKDGSPVGSIGTQYGYLGIGTQNTGVYFHPTIPAIVPCDPSSAFVNRDAAIDIGVSNVRFKNLHLSGGVYLGGIGAANYLDDAEYGVWNPANSQITLAASNGNYVKVGRMCTVTFRLVWPTNSNTVQARISLPFACASHGSAAHMAGLAIAFTTYTATPSGGVYSNQAYMEFFKGGSNALTNADLSGKQINGSVTYITNS